jgi:hypothetical protein
VGLPGRVGEQGAAMTESPANSDGGPDAGVDPTTMLPGRLRSAGDEAGADARLRRTAVVW